MPFVHGWFCNIQDFIKLLESTGHPVAVLVHLTKKFVERNLTASGMRLLTKCFRWTRVICFLLLMMTPTPSEGDLEP
jgi:hypothetical protein